MENFKQGEGAGANPHVPPPGENRTTAHAQAQARTMLPLIQGNSKFTGGVPAGMCGEEEEAGFLYKGRRRTDGCGGLLDTPLYPPGAQSPRPQAHKHGADKFPKGGSVHRVQLVLLAVSKVMVVQRASGETDTFGSFIII